MRSSLLHGLLASQRALPRVCAAIAASAFSGILMHCCVSVYLVNFYGDASSSFRLVAYLLVFLCIDCVC
jgi:hypothetical protein